MDPKGAFFNYVDKDEVGRWYWKCQRYTEILPYNIEELYMSTGGR